MATTTSLLSLTKPDGGEAAAVSVLNANMDILDNAVTLTGSQTLSNKTLTGPHMTTPIVDSGGLTITGGLTVNDTGVTINGGGVTLGTGGGTLRVVDATGAGTNGYLTLGSTFASLGGGATPTLGTIGGSGPASASQSQWWMIRSGLTAFFIPIWV